MLTLFGLIMTIEICLFCIVVEQVTSKRKTQRRGRWS